MTESNARIEAALARLGAEHQPPVGWEARVLAATARTQRPWWLVPIPVAVLAAIAIAIAVVIVIAPGPTPFGATLAVTFTRDSAVAYRAPSMMVGDVMRAKASGGSGQRAVWIYRDGRLLRACPGDPQCVASDDATIAELALPSVGRYLIVAVTSSADIPVPMGSEDADVAAAEGAGAKLVRDRVPVH